jgi:hypothetical protein
MGLGGIVLMASNETALTKPLVEVEILNPSQLPTLREDLATMEKYRTDLDPIYNEAMAMQKAGGIKDGPKRIRAGELIAAFKKIVKDAENKIEPHKTQINRFKEEYIMVPERKVVNRGEEIRALLTSMMGDWDRAEEAKRKADQDRQKKELQARLDREAEEKRQADEEQAKELRKARVAEIRADLRAGKITKRQAEKQLRAAGATEEAAKAQASAEEDEAKEKSKLVAETVKVKSNVPIVSGNTRRINYSAKCTNPRLFILEMIVHRNDAEVFERLLAMVEVSDSLLSEQARKIKTHDDDDKHDLTAGQFKTLYPFVELSEKRSY